MIYQMTRKRYYEEVKRRGSKSALIRSLNQRQKYMKKITDIRTKEAKA